MNLRRYIGFQNTFDDADIYKFQQAIEVGLYDNDKQVKKIIDKALSKIELTNYDKAQLYDKLVNEIINYKEIKFTPVQTKQNWGDPSKDARGRKIKNAFGNNLPNYTIQTNFFYNMPEYQDKEIREELFGLSRTKNNADIMYYKARNYGLNFDQSFVIAYAWNEKDNKEKARYYDLIYPKK